MIDPPTWPAHGTLFSHVVSDSSYAELHRFARLNSLSERAFDLDHYDVPAELYDHLVAAGALEVDGRELTRRLIRSGLRVPLKERPDKIRNILTTRWESTLPGQEKLGSSLLEEWGAPGRFYHNSVHLLEMLVALEELYAPRRVPRAVILASWFHDLVYQGKPGADERASAHCAHEKLAPLVNHGVLSAEEATDIQQLILATIDHQLPTTPLTRLSSADGKYFLDADMAILASPSSRYFRYVQAVRAEYSRFSDEEFRQGRSAILNDFLARENLYLSDTGKRLWQSHARVNLRAELEAMS